MKITITGDGNESGYGTQMTALDASSNPITGFSAPSSNAQIATLSSGREYLEHDGISSTGEIQLHPTG